jgi:hypothetical protein
MWEATVQTGRVVTRPARVWFAAVEKREIERILPWTGMDGDYHGPLAEHHDDSAKL